MSFEKFVEKYGDSNPLPVDYLSTVPPNIGIMKVANDSERHGQF